MFSQGIVHAAISPHSHEFAAGKVHIYSVFRLSVRLRLKCSTESALQIEAEFNPLCSQTLHTRES